MQFVQNVFMPKYDPTIEDVYKTVELKNRVFFNWKIFILDNWSGWETIFIRNSWYGWKCKLIRKINISFSVFCSYNLGRIFFYERFIC